MENKYIKALLIIIGSLSAILGVIGIFLPLVPTTPFLLLAIACYSRSSTRLYNVLCNNKLLGRYLRNYREGRDISPQTKSIILFMLWLSIGYSVVYRVQNPWAKGVMLLIALGVTVHVFFIKRLNS